MRTTRTAACIVASLALATTPALVACQNGSSTSSTSSVSSDDSDSTSDETADSDSDQSAEPEESAKDGASSTPTTSTAQPAPADSQEITGPTTNLTFAVPKDWTDIKNLDPSEKETIAQTMGLDSATLDQQISSFDVFYRAKEPSSSGFYNNVNMASQTLLLTSTPSEFDITSLLTQQSATLKEYSTRQTANGEAAVGTYTMEANGQRMAGTVIMVPTSQPAAGYANYATIYVSAGSAEEAEQVTNTIIDTVH